MLDTQKIPLEIDVWNVIESEMNTGLVDVLDLRFEYSVEKRKGTLRIRHPHQSRISTKLIELDKVQAEDLIMALSSKFNFQWYNIAEMSFELNPGEVPIFNTKIYPVVNDASALDKKKYRSSSITID